MRIVSPSAVVRSMVRVVGFTAATVADTAAPLATGMLAYAHAGGAPYETLLGVHILSVAALMIWFPFGKLMHALTIFAARGAQGILFERRGASL